MKNIRGDSMLDERKLRVLHAIINSYIDTAEPIGSRTISKQYDLGVSSATIRNEMSDLEDLGYLNKPHSSAGRIPSDKAYRLYVNEILKNKNHKIDLRKKEEIKKILVSQSMEIDQLIQNAAKILSTLTSYTALAISAQLKDDKIKHIQLIPIDTRQILLVLVTTSGVVKNSIFRLNMDVPEDQIITLSNLLNDKLRGASLSQLNDHIFSSIIREMYDYKEVIDNIVPIISKSMEEIGAVDLYSDGVTKILNFPEYKDLEKAKSFISFIEDKDMVMTILGNNPISKDIEITIGNENTHEAIKDCSIITTTYKIGDRTIGKIGIIGPTRMDYLKLVDTLHLFSANINEITNMILDKHFLK